MADASSTRRTSEHTEQRGDDVGDRILALRAILAEERARRQRRGRWTGALLAAYASALVVLTLLAALRIYRLPIPVYVVMTPLYFLVMRSLTQPLFTSRRQRQAALDLASLHNVHALPGLLEAMEMGASVPDEVQQAAAASLARLPADGLSLLGSQHLAVLRRAIAGSPSMYEASFSTELVVAAIRSVEAIGSASDLADIARLANRTPRSERGRLIRDAAKHCLPILEARVKAQESAGVLLRPSEAPMDELLRPAAGAESEGSASLLRAAHPQRSQE